MLSIIILTYNSSSSIRRTLDSIKGLSNDICVVDSYSSDDTVELCKKYGCSVTQREFINYSNQRNWAIDNLPLRYEWQLHIDADEEFEDNLVEQIRALDLTKSSYDGFIIGRKTVFLGKVLRYGGIARTWHCRLFRSGKGRCEERLYDQHFICSGLVSTIRGFMLDHQELSISEWTQRHNRWASMEADEILQAGGQKSNVNVVQGKFSGNVIERKRQQKKIYYHFPLFLRPILYFIFRYFFLLGFLDGRRGLVYHILQGFWFHFLVDAKLYEKTISDRGKSRSV